jgi:hypothetical protein
LLANERKISTSHNQGHSGGADQGRDSWPIGTNGEVTELLARCGVAPDARPEVLSPVEWIRVVEALEAAR